MYIHQLVFSQKIESDGTNIRVREQTDARIFMYTPERGLHEFVLVLTVCKRQGDVDLDYYHIDRFVRSRDLGYRTMYA